MSEKFARRGAKQNEDSMKKSGSFDRVRAIAATAFLVLVTACGAKNNEGYADEELTPYLLVFVGDQDGKNSDFITVIDVDPNSETLGAPLVSVETGLKSSMPHHMEYVPPPKGEPVFMNAHHHEQSMIVDVSDPLSPKIEKTFSPPAPLRFPHDYTRTPNGTRLVGFLRSEGASVDPDEDTLPGNHGGIAEYNIDGELLRMTSAAVPGMSKPIRPYAFALLPDADRLVVTSAPMMESAWADVVQVYRYSDFELLHTLNLPAGRLKNGKIIEGANAAGFGPIILEDGSVFFNTYGCAFYHLSEIESASPQLEMVYTLKTKPARSASTIRGACGVPFRINHFWIQPVGELNTVLVLDISDPKLPQEVFRLTTPSDFKPHWLAKDPRANRLILGAELGGEQGFYMLRFDEGSGRLMFDRTFNGFKNAGLFRSKKIGYISLQRQEWPHGKTGPAWGHAALFIDN